MDIRIFRSYEKNDFNSEVTVFIDVFRAATTLACIFEKGCNKVVIPMDDAQIPGYIDQGYALVSEVLKTGMDNSPSSFLNLNEKIEKVVFRTRNLTTSIINNLGFNKGLIAGFVNIDSVVSHIKEQGYTSVKIIPASYFSKKKPAIEDQACASMLEKKLSGIECTSIPFKDKIDKHINNRRIGAKAYPDYYWDDVKIALNCNSVSNLMEIVKEPDLLLVKSIL